MSFNLAGYSKFPKNRDSKSAIAMTSFKVENEDENEETSAHNKIIPECLFQPHINVDFSKTGLLRLIVTGCRNIFDVVAVFNKPQFDQNADVLLINFEINDANVEFDSDSFVLLASKYIQRSVILSIISRQKEKFSLYWKSKNIKSFFIFKNYNESYVEHNQQLLTFIEEFLGNSLIKGHLGLFSYVTAQKEIKIVELHLLADSRDFNLMLLAAEQGNDKIVKILLKFGLSSESAFKNINAQSLAYKNQHYLVLLLLLQSNLTYPEELDIDHCSEEVKTFHNLNIKLHNSIIADNAEDVISILDQNPQLRYFYNYKNESAAAIALRAKNVEMYKILTAREVFVGPHEDTDEIMEDLEHQQRRELREIHHDHLQELPEKHLSVLISKSFVGHDVPDVKHKVGLFHQAFDILNGISFIRILLKIVAASRNFQIIFDFNRDSVQLADPTTTSMTTGIIYFSGRIYIGAKQLLHKLTKSETLGTIAHEFCHHAVNLTFGNKAKPYYKNDMQSMQEFEEISEHCIKHMEKEEVIGSVFTCYPIDRQHAELIVRVPHLLALYHNQPEKLKEVSEVFNPLFDFYKQRVVPEMEKALPNIEASADKEMREKDKKISKLIKILITFGILSIFGIFLAGYIFHKPTYSFDSLSQSDQNKVRAGLANYIGENVKLSDLFSINSTAYEKLNSDAIDNILKGNSLDLNNIHSNYLDGFIYHSWGNLTEKLKQKFLNSNFTFQNESVKFDDLYQMSPNVLNSLTSDEIKFHFKGMKINVGKSLSNDTLFYVERYFKNKTVSEDFGFYDRFADQTGLMMSNEQTIFDTHESKLLILSSEAGSGKTIAFNQLSLTIKKMFPMQWVSYIDLKANVKFFNPNGTIGEVEELLFDILQLAQKSRFEQEIFKAFYRLGQVTILWNGFDEISPVYSDFIVNVISYTKNNTSNVQYVCTRPQYSKIIENKLKSSSFDLVPLNEEEQEEFLQKYFTIVADEKDSKDGLAEVKKIIAFLKGDDSDRDFNSPLMLLLVAKTYKKIGLNKPLNVYEMYEEFVKEKIQIWIDKRSIDKNKDLELIGSRGNIFEFHQKYALRSELSEKYYTNQLLIRLIKLNILQEKFNGLSYANISSMGIMHINSETEFDFVHITFAEFFCVQYFAEKIYLQEESINDEEAELRIALFYGLLSEGFSGIKIEIFKDFLKKHQNNNAFNPQISETLVSKFKMLLLRFLRWERSKVSFDFLFEFLSKDPVVFRELLHIDEDETFFTALYNPDLQIRSKINIEEINRLLKLYLNNKDYSKIIKGKNQRGKFLAGILYNNLLKSKHLQFRDDKIILPQEYTIELEKVRNLTYWESFGALKSMLTLDEQKELFKSASIVRYYNDVTFNLSRYENLWSNFENLFSSEELKALILNAMHGGTELDFLLQKAEQKLNDSQIQNMFYNLTIFDAEDLIAKDNFYKLWQFYSKHSTEINQKDILRFNFLGFIYQLHLPHMNIFQMALLSGEKQMFEIVASMYNAYFEVSEILDILLNPIDIILFYCSRFYIFRASVVFRDFDEYLAQLFQGNQSKIKSYLCKKVKGTTKNVFELVEMYEEAVPNLNKFYNNLMNADNIADAKLFCRK